MRDYVTELVMGVLSEVLYYDDVVLMCSKTGNE